ncbi:hypothetical protein [Novosphingobium sp. Gsoil 351]|uniref:hypothetical protein n=1 Tax=Novosphingobium sp. Gsoil 351 TaxID=2675225 RepID=UPI0012B4AB4C|nr:hypothetical protein [Novosphingobium sp. Gsoil 351]QGN53541.1 hypothetical protein GKE62_02230 [Novosphingobium sp. Gsoil 351]
MTMSLRHFIPLALAASVVPAALAAMPPAEAWEIGPIVRVKNYSEGMPFNPDRGANGSVIFEFPQAGSGQVDAMTARVGPLTGARTITMRYRIDAARGTRFVADETPGEPATISLYFQRRGDNWNAKGAYESFRWYVPSRAVVPLSPGLHTITVGMDENWTNVHGRSNREIPDGFAAALEDTARLGIAFGSASRRSHGVYATGPARFTLLSLDVD